jgi:hypothetical protein
LGCLELVESRDEVVRRRPRIALTQWLGVLDTAIDRGSDGEHVIVTAGGVDKIEFSSLSVDGDSATASGRAHTWVTWKINKTDVPGPRTGRPTGWDLFKVTLLKVDGQWLVSQLDLEPKAQADVPEPRCVSAGRKYGALG